MRLDGLIFRDGHAVDAEYANMPDLVEAEDDDDNDKDLEGEGFEVNVDVETLNTTYQWIDNLLCRVVRGLCGCGQFDRGLKK